MPHSDEIYLVRWKGGFSTLHETLEECFEEVTDHVREMILVYKFERIINVAKP